MSEYGKIEVHPRRLSDEEWVEAISGALNADLRRDLRDKVVEELLAIRKLRQTQHGALTMQFSAPAA